MTEVPHIIERWKRKEARRDLMTIQALLATEGMGMDEDNRDALMDALREQAYGGATVDDSDEFDADGLAALRDKFGGRI